MKKLSAFIVSIMILSFSLGSFGYDDGDFSYSYDVASRTGTVTGYRGTAQNVTIPSTFVAVERYQDENHEWQTRHYTITVTTIGYRAFFRQANITSISLPDTVHTIGSYAFYESGIISIQTPKSLTYLGEYVFDSCHNLKSAVVDGHNLIIDTAAFSYCENLESVTFGNGVESFAEGGHYFNDYGMFIGCSNLKVINIQSSKVKRIPSYFCTGTSIEMVSFPAVTEIGYKAFDGCGKLREVGSFASVVSVEDGAFGGCASFEGPLDCPSLQKIGSWAFSGCASLNGRLNLPVVETIDKGAFYDCKNLSGLYMPTVRSIAKEAFKGCCGVTDALDIVAESIGTSAFEGCSGLTSIKTSSALSYLGNAAFYMCAGLKSVEINGDGTLALEASTLLGCVGLETAILGQGVASIADGHYDYRNPSGLFSGCTSLKSVDVRSEKITKVADCMFIKSSVERVSFANATTIGYKAFDSCDKLVEVPFISSVKEIGASAFSGCTSLAGPLDFSSVETIGASAFSGCAALTGSVNFTSVVSIQGGAFSGCVSLGGQLSVPLLTEVGDSAFDGCSSLTGISAPLLAAIGERSFLGCTGLTGELWLPAMETTRAFAFYGCRGLESVRTPKTTSLLDWGTFEDCSGLVRATIDGNGELHVGGYMFSGCTSLEEAVFEEGVASIDDGSIGGTFGGYHYYMFENCNKLTSVHVKSPKVTKVPDYMFCGTSVERVSFANVTIVGKYAFADCNKLVEAPSLGKVEDIGYRAFAGCSSFAFGELDLPVVKTIQGYAFDGCSGLAGVAFGRSLTSIGYDAFCSCRNAGWFSFAGAPPFVESGFYSVKNGATGTYTGAHKSAWENEISSDGDWKGLKMNGRIDCIVHFDANGGEFRDGNGNAVKEFDQYFTCGEPQELFTDDLVPQNGEHKFLGWSRDNPNIASASDLIYDRAVRTFDGDVTEMTLYAVWTKSVTVSFYNKETTDGKMWLAPVSLTDHLTWSVDTGLSSGRVTKNSGETTEVAPGGRTIVLECDGTATWLAGWFSARSPYDRYYDPNKGIIVLDVKTGLIDKESDEAYGDVVIHVKAEPPKSSGYVWFYCDNAVNELLPGNVRNLKFDISRVDISLRCVVRNENGNLVDVPGTTLSGFKAEENYLLPQGLYFINDVTYHVEKVSGSPYWEPILPTSFDRRVFEIKGDSSYRPEIPIKFDIHGWSNMTDEWLRKFPGIAAASSGNDASAANLTAANGCRTVGECYALGINPEDPNDDLRIAEFKMENGKPVIKLNHTEDGSGNSFADRVRTLGKEKLTDPEWKEVPENGNPDFRFFTIGVDMP